MLGGLALSAPAVYHHEYLALPFNAALGMAAGVLGRFVEKEEIWSFTPFIDLSLYRWVRRNLRQPRIDRQFLMLFLIVAAEACRDWIAHAYPHRLFALVASQFWVQALVCLCAPINVGIALKVWNTLRIEMKLDEQKRLLLEARLDALQRQINPHFLFNTLNSIASLVRVKPELAREMIVKLGNILRALLKEHDSYVPLSEELKFTDDYLDIEVVRFGAGSSGAQHSLAAADRKQHQARPGAAPEWRNGHTAQPPRRRPRAHRSGRRRRRHGQPAGLGAPPHRSGHRHEERAGAARSPLWQPGQLQRGQQSGPRHAGLD
jgi:hypothetical protein